MPTADAAMAHGGATGPRERPGRQKSGRVDALHIALVNLMPDKAAAVRQFGRLLARAGRPASLTLTIPDGYEPKHAGADHMATFYRPWSTLDIDQIDGVIVTGAPLEHLPYAEVRYWPALAAIFNDLCERACRGCRSAGRRRPIFGTVMACPSIRSPPRPSGSTGSA